MTMVSMPTQSDISQLLGLIELVRLAADAGKAESVLAKMRAERQAYDDAIARSEDAQRRATAERAEADARIEQASRADAMAAAITGAAENLRADAAAEREEASAYVNAARDKANQAAALERAAEAVKESAARALESAKAKAAAIVAEAQAELDKARAETEAAAMKRAEYETKIERLRSVTQE